MNRSPFALTQILLGLIAALLFAIFLVLFIRREKQTAPNLDGLSQALQKSAENALPAPSVASERITVTAQVGDVEAAVDRILKIAADLGGTAVKTPISEGGFSLLVQIPGAQAGRFVGLVTDKPPVATESDGTRFIEVIISK